MKWTLIAPPSDSGERIDTLLARCGTHSRSALARMLEEGRVSCDGARAAKSRKLYGGETVEVELPEPSPSRALPEDIPIDVLYEDGDLLVVNKQRGLVTHPAPGHPGGTLVNALLRHCEGRLSGVGGELRPGIVHRIDKNTSGLIIAAKNDFAHRRLSASLASRDISRVYMAVAAGYLDPPEGLIDAPIGRHPTKRARMAVVSGGRPARTRYRVLERLNGCCLLRCELETGRTHQIRAHMAHVGHPLMGDPVYGGRPVKGIEGQMLHACELSFSHPRDGRPMRFTAPPPEEFSRAADMLR